MRPRPILLLIFAAFCALAAGSISLMAQSPGGKQPSPVATENAKPGTSAWKAPTLHRGSEPGERPAVPVTQAEPPPYALPVISGYADLTSVNKGGAINFYISTSQSTYTINVYRMGWYAGAGSRLMLTVSGKTGQNQPLTAPDANGMVEANWTLSHTLQTGNDWVSGIYLAKLTPTAGADGYIMFVVRDDAQVADIVYQVPVATYQAYNGFGGKSLYDFNSTNSIQATKVSFNRPYENWDGAGDFFDGDYSMVRWLESQGYNVTYTTSIDTQTSPQLLNGRKIFLANFHDEYWSKQMRDNLTAARDRGMNLAFFAANSIYWQIRYEDAPNGANRRIVSYKESATTKDPLRTTSPGLTTTTWRGAPVNLPENALLGSMYESYFNYTKSFPWIVQNASNWVYAGTGVTNGTSIAGLVGYEYDRTYSNGLTPSTWVQLSNSPVTDINRKAGIQNGGVYVAPSGAIVFNAGTIHWAWKLDNNEFTNVAVDARVQKMTSNVLNMMLTGLPATPTPTATNTSVPTATATSTPTATNTPIPTPTSLPTNTPTSTPTGAPTNPPTATATPTNTPASTATNTPIGTPTATATPPASTFAVKVYTDGLSTGWSNNSWNATVNLAATSPVYLGTKSASVAITSAWGGFYVRTTTAVPASGLTTLSFALQASGAGQRYAVGAVNGSGTMIGSVVALANAGGDPVAGTWKVYEIPIGAAGLNVAAQSIGGFYIQDLKGAAQPAVYIDEIGFRGSVPSTPTPTPTPPPGPALTVYDDLLAGGWADSSWNATVNLAAATPVLAGTNSIGFSVTSAWGALYLTTSSSVATTTYGTLQFSMQASAAGQQYAVALVGTNGSVVGNAVLLSAAGGDPLPGAWTSYVIPLGSGGFNAAGQPIIGFFIQDYTGAAQPLAYVDEVRLQ